MKLTDLETADPRAAARHSTSYYGQPAIKAPPWKWEVPAYLFVSALAGASQVIGAIAASFGAPKMRYVTRNARYVAVAAAGTGAALLIGDLKTPRRWYNMLRILRRTSPMSVGTYIVSTFGLSSFITALREWRATKPGLATPAQIPAALAGSGMMIYTAPLLSSTSNPYWARDPELRAAKYGSSAIQLAASALSLLERAANRSDSARALENLSLVATSVNTLVSLAAETRSPAVRDREASRELELHRAASVLSTVAPLFCYALARLAPARGRQLSIAGSLCAIAGVALSKWSDVSTGKHCAGDPELYLEFAQPHREQHGDEDRV
jgi:hypothetical protein